MHLLAIDMRIRHLAPALSLLALLSSGCQDQGGTAVQSSQPVAGETGFPEPLREDASGATTPPDGTTTINTKVAPGNGTPVRILAGQSVSGTSRPEASGSLAAIGVRIGNYHGSADGSLQLSLCVDGTCQEATAPLAGSKDNAYLIFTLATPVVLQADSAIEYRFHRSADSTNRVAIWGYPAPAGQSGIIDADGASTTLVPRLSLHLMQP